MGGSRSRWREGRSSILVAMRPRSTPVVPDVLVYVLRMHARAPRLEQARSPSRLIGSALAALAVTVTAAAAGIAFAPAAAGAATPSRPRLSDGYGLHVVSQQRVNSR